MKEASGSTLLDMSEEVWQSIDQKAVASTDAGLKLWVHTTLRHAEMFMSNKTFYLWFATYMLKRCPCKSEHSMIHAQRQTI